MIIGYLYLVGVTVAESEAHAVLVVDSDAPLARPIANEYFEPVRWRNTEVIDLRRRVDTLQSHPRAFGNIRWEPALSGSLEEPFGSRILKALNHGCIVSRYMLMYQMTIRNRAWCRNRLRIQFTRRQVGNMAAPFCELDM